jgi:hypothetical protein
MAAQAFEQKLIVGEVRCIRPGVSCRVNAIHDPVAPASGYRVDYQGHSIVFSGDTTFSSNLVQHAKGVDLLVHEVLLSPPGATAQTTLSWDTTRRRNRPHPFSSKQHRVSPYIHISWIKREEAPQA